jgi:hypothetical protein
MVINYRRTRLNAQVLDIYSRNIIWVYTRCIQVDGCSATLKKSCTRSVTVTNAARLPSSKSYRFKGFMGSNLKTKYIKFKNLVSRKAENTVESLKPIELYLYKKITCWFYSYVFNKYDSLPTLRPKEAHYK